MKQLLVAGLVVAAAVVGHITADATEATDVPLGYCIFSQGYWVHASTAHYASSYPLTPIESTFVFPAGLKDGKPVCSPDEKFVSAVPSKNALVYGPKR